MKQKFRKLTFVKVTDKLPEFMSHFDSGFVAIVDGTYSQIYGTDDIKSYSLFKVEGDKVTNASAWYDESHLTELSDQDRLKAEVMIEDYRLS